MVRVLIWVADKLGGDIMILILSPSITVSVLTVSVFFGAVLH